MVGHTVNGAHIRTVIGNSASLQVAWRRIEAANTEFANPIRVFSRVQISVLQQYMHM